jgi:predicted nucleic acid-binding protein
VILLDANHILRWFLDDVPDHALTVERLLQDAGPESIIIDRVTVAEVTDVLRSQGYDHGQVHTVLTELSRWPAIAPWTEVESRALDVYRDTALDYEDCLLIARALDEHAEVATFDKALLRELKRRR